jgi:hypothetical protein
MHQLSCIYAVIDSMCPSFVIQHHAFNVLRSAKVLDRVKHNCLIILFIHMSEMVCTGVWCILYAPIPVKTCGFNSLHHCVPREIYPIDFAGDEDVMAKIFELFGSFSVTRP